MTEDVESVESEETDPTYSDEELWESDEESTDEAEPSDTEEEVEEAEEEDESEDEDPAHDYEKRYKDLEREFHRRNEESARMREELNDLRIRTLEERQAPPEQKDRPVDPTDADSFFNEDDRTTMDEFSEITGVTKKLIEHEVAKRLQSLQPNLQKVDQMEQQLQDQTYNQFLKSHESFMLDSVGSDYRDIDRHPQFQNWVLASPALTKMMTESVEATDHASVMNLWLDTTEHGKKYRPPKEPVQSSEKQATRRKAASSLMTNSAPRTQKNPDSMSDEELWESIPE